MNQNEVYEEPISIPNASDGAGLPTFVIEASGSNDRFCNSYQEPNKNNIPSENFGPISIIAAHGGRRFSRGRLWEWW